MNATLRWTLPPDLLILNYDDEATTEDTFMLEDVTIGNYVPIFHITKQAKLLHLDIVKKNQISSLTWFWYHNSMTLVLLLYSRWWLNKNQEGQAMDTTFDPCYLLWDCRTRFLGLFLPGSSTCFHIFGCSFNFWKPF